MKLLSRCLSGWLLLGGMVLFGAPVFLADHQASAYGIVVAPAAIPAEQTAARELQTLLEKSTGAKLPIGTKKNGPTIWVGQSAAALQALGLKSWDELKPDEIRIKTVGNDLFLVGARPRGTLYSVYEFLERQLGIRFWTAGATDVPQHAQLVLPQLDYRYVPPLQVRSAGYQAIFSHPEFAVKMRNNASDYHIPAAWGGDVRLLGGVHTFSDNAPLIPAKTYFTKHPEWFAERNGRRQGNNSQLCLTNPELRRELTRRVLERLAQHPEYRYISVSQNDNTNYCQCPVCTAFVKQHGNQTDLLIDAINEVAVEVKKKYPSVLVETLAYLYTRTPPQSIRPRDNVIVRYCTIERQSFTPLTDRRNQDIYRDLMGWKQKARQLMIWNYVTNFAKYYQPYPNWPVLAADLRLFRDCGAISVYEQGSFNGGGSIADLSDLRAWLVSKLLWNPDLNTDQLIQEFLTGYYGPAAPVVASYITLMNQAVSRHPDNNINYWNALSTVGWLDEPTLLKAWKIMTDAEKKFFPDPVYGPRFAAAAFPITCALLERHEIWKEKPEQRPEGLRPVNYADLIQAVVKTAETEGLQRMGEGGLSPADWSKKLIFQHKMFFARIPNDGPAPHGVVGKKYYAWSINKLVKVHALNRESFIEKDPAASTGTAIRMPNTHNNWHVQGFDFPHGDFDLYVEVRCDSANPQGNAVRFGAYNWARRMDNGKDFSAREIVGKDYHMVKLGRVKLSNNMCFYVAPVINPAVKNIWIDRLILIPVAQK